MLGTADCRGSWLMQDAQGQQFVGYYFSPSNIIVASVRLYGFFARNYNQPVVSLQCDTPDLYGSIGIFFLGGYVTHTMDRCTGVQTGPLAIQNQICPVNQEDPENRLTIQDVLSNLNDSIGPLNFNGMTVPSPPLSSINTSPAPSYKFSRICNGNPLSGGFATELGVTEQCLGAQNAWNWESGGPYVTVWAAARTRIWGNVVKERVDLIQIPPSFLPASGSSSVIEEIEAGPYPGIVVEDYPEILAPSEVNQRIAMGYRYKFLGYP